LPAIVFLPRSSFTAVRIVANYDRSDKARPDSLANQALLTALCQQPGASV
tara:strand:- start:215 stop:364 length:150 start_codon:yes stop_codon:yes gene_type:complete